MRFFVFLWGCWLSGCGDGNTDTDNVAEPISSLRQELPDNTYYDEYRVLFIGNSHVAGLSPILEEMIKVGLPEKHIMIEKADGLAYLIERINDGKTYQHLKDQQWSHVILQAQKYSTTRTQVYSTGGAKTWIRRVRDEVRATPILFPEHPQKGDTTEARYIHTIHDGIAKIEPACVAPIGLAWDRAIELYPELSLYVADGNHASLLGRFLTAAVFYQIITGESADLLPHLSNTSVDSTVQANLRAVASYAIANNLPCKY